MMAVWEAEENQGNTSSFFQESLAYAWSTHTTPAQAITFLITASIFKYNMDKYNCSSPLCICGVRM